MLMENQNADKANLDQRLQEKYDKRDELKCKLNKYRKEVTAQNNAKSSLKTSISDLEKVVGDFSVEQSRLKMKQTKLLDETVELEQELV